jgi:hypothetical protein
MTGSSSTGEGIRVLLVRAELGRRSLRERALGDRERTGRAFVELAGLTGDLPDEFLVLEFAMAMERPGFVDVPPTQLLASGKGVPTCAWPPRGRHRPATTSRTPCPCSEVA